MMGMTTRWLRAAVVTGALAALALPGAALANESVRNGRLQMVHPDDNEVVISGETLRVDAGSSLHLLGSMEELSLIELEDYLGEFVSVVKTGTPGRVLELSVHDKMDED